MNKIHLTFVALVLGASGMYAAQGQKCYDWAQWAWNKAINSNFSGDIQQYDKNAAYWIQRRSTTAIVPTDKCRVIRMLQSVWADRWMKYDAAKSLAWKCVLGAVALVAGGYAARLSEQQKLLLIIVGSCLGGIGLFNWLYRNSSLEGRVAIQPHDNLAPQLAQDDGQYAHIALEGLMESMRHTIETPYVTSPEITQRACACPHNNWGQKIHTVVCQQIVAQQQATYQIIQSQAHIAQQQANLFSPEPIVETPAPGGQPLLYEGQYHDLPRP